MIEAGSAPTVAAKRRGRPNVVTTFGHKRPWRYRQSRSRLTTVHLGLGRRCGAVQRFRNVIVLQFDKTLLTLVRAVVVFRR